MSAPREILLNTAGGLANRLRAIVSAGALAADAGLPLRIVWQPLRLLNARFSQLFDPEALPFPIVDAGFVSGSLLYQAPGKRNLYLPAINQSRYGIRLYDDDRSVHAIADHPDELLRRVNEAGSLFVSTGLDFYTSDPLDAYHEWFRPSPLLEQRLSELAPLVGPHTVGVHIRRTDNAVSIASSPIELFVSRMEQIIHEDPEAAFYIATDDPDTKRQLLNRFPGRAAAMDRPVTRGTLDGMLDAAAEMILLSRTRLILGSHYSSYSILASRITRIPIDILAL